MGQFYSGQVAYVVEPVNSVLCSSNNVYSVFSSQSQAHIYIIAKLRIMSSTAPSKNNVLYLQKKQSLHRSLKEQGS